MITFILLGIIIVALAAISCLPGAAWAYTSLPMVILWGATGLTALWYCIRRRLYRRPATALLHLALGVILAGAAVTHFSGTSSTLRLRLGQSADVGGIKVTLNEFHIDYYPGTTAPCDYVATLQAGADTLTVAMNRVASADGHRIFLTAADSDSGGCTFTVSHDPVGNAVTYAGYGLLLLAMLLCSLPRRLTGGVALTLAMLATAPPANATPRVLPVEVAEEFGRQLCVNHNGRIAPLSTMAADFTRKLTGSGSYRGLTPEQVLTGWLFYYDDWRDEPCIALRDASTRRALGGRRQASLSDFFTPEGGYRFNDFRFSEANEKFAIVSSAATGSIWRIFPCDGRWYSPVDTDLPAGMDMEQWEIIRLSFNHLAQQVQEADWPGVVHTVTKLSHYQQLNAAHALPSTVRIRAERGFMAMAPEVWPPVVMLLAGLALLLARPRRGLVIAAVAIAFLWTATLFTLNWIASGRLPMANGSETMQLMALIALIIALAAALRRGREPLGAVCLTVAALALTVAVMGSRNPQVTQLMPVLRSPLLSIHVLAVMTAYALLAIMAVISAMWLCGRRELLPAARAMLRPAVFTLTAGIFIGAVWANTSWGRYWGWDPKEVWALITLLIYSLPLHRAMLPWLTSDRAWARFCLIAFLSVIMTFFGVNYLLGGLHSYA